MEAAQTKTVSAGETSRRETFYWLALALGLVLLPLEGIRASWPALLVALTGMVFIRLTWKSVFSEPSSSSARPVDGPSLVPSRAAQAKESEDRREILLPVLLVLLPFALWFWLRMKTAEYAKVEGAELLGRSRLLSKEGLASGWELGKLVVGSIGGSSLQMVRSSSEVHHPGGLAIKRFFSFGRMGRGVRIPLASVPEPQPETPAPTALAPSSDLTALDPDDPVYGRTGSSGRKALGNEDLREGSFDFLKIYRFADLVDYKRRAPLPPSGGYEDPSLMGRLRTWVKSSDVWYQLRLAERTGRGSVQLATAENRLLGTRATFFGEDIPMEAEGLADYGEDLVVLDKSFEDIKSSLAKRMRDSPRFQDHMRKACALKKLDCRRHGDGYENAYPCRDYETSQCDEFLSSGG